MDAWDGSRMMQSGDTIHQLNKPVDHSIRGSSSWLRVVREKATEYGESGESARAEKAA
jgi:hypothetical protein